MRIKFNNDNNDYSPFQVNNMLLRNNIKLHLVISFKVIKSSTSAYLLCKNSYKPKSYYPTKESYF